MESRSLGCRVTVAVKERERQIELLQRIVADSLNTVVRIRETSLAMLRTLEASEETIRRSRELLRLHQGPLATDPLAHWKSEERATSAEAPWFAAASE